MIRGHFELATRGVRAFSHGKITDLSSAFKLDNESAFTIVVVPKASVTGRLVSAPNEVGILVNCTLINDASPADMLVTFNWPSEGLIYEISANAIDLETYDVYWSSGYDDSKS